MKIRIASILLLTMFSCNLKREDGWQLATEFYEQYSHEFIKNGELLKYSYDPRTQFYYLTKNESKSFRCIARDSVELLIINLGGVHLFQHEFGIELDTAIEFSRAFLRNEKESLLLTLNDSIQINLFASKTNPVAYFNELKNLIEKYGIVTYGEIRLGGIIEVYLTAYDYLLYFPTDFKIEEEHFYQHWMNKRKNGRKLDENWYYYQSEKPLDFG